MYVCFATFVLCVLHKGNSVMVKPFFFLLSSDLQCIGSIKVVYMINFIFSTTTKFEAEQADYNIQCLWTAHNLNYVDFTSHTIP